MAKIQTVRGDISPDNLGITITHEHLFLYMDSHHGAYEREVPPVRATLSKYDSPLTLENLSELRRNPSLSKENITFNDVNMAIEEVTEYKKMGGKSIVDVTPEGCGRDPMALYEVSNATDLNIIAATGAYVGGSHPEYIRKMTLEELTEHMIKEVTVGIDDTDIKAGVIKIAVLYHEKGFDEREEKVLRAAARTQAETGIAATIHPGMCDFDGGQWDFYAKEADKYIEIAESEGGTRNKFYISHIDQWCNDIDYIKKILDLGINIDFDTFGNETYDDTFFMGYSMPSDRERVKALVELCESGYDKQITLAHDIFSKTMYKRWGGYGYGHILRHIVPSLEVRGVTKKQIDNMLINNTKRLLTM